MKDKEIVIKEKIIESLEENKIEVRAEEGGDFQKYVYSDGKPVPIGTIIGYECKGKDGEWEIELKSGIYYI